MKIQDTGRAGRPGVRRSLSPAVPATDTPAAAGSPSVGDVASFLGIPEPELTPSVREGLSRLLAEVGRLRRDNDILTKRVAYLERLADEDPLIPILNRRAFVRELSRIMAYCERYRVVSSVLYLDVNGLKALNDHHGHAAGDAALTHVAQTLLSQVRSSDVIGRLGGDEFGVILNQAGLDIAKTKGAQLAQAVRETPFFWHEQELRVDVAVGAFAFDGLSSATDVLDRADQEMYAHKHSGDGDSPGGADGETPE